MTRGTLQTFGDWASLLTPPLQKLDDETLTLVNAGTFEKSSSLRVLGLVKDSVESLINGQTTDLLRMLDECGGSNDDIVTVVRKYDRSCRRILKLCDIEGLPSVESDELAAEVMRYVSGVFAELKEEFGEAGFVAEDIEYCLIKLEKCWIICE